MLYLKFSFWTKSFYLIIMAQINEEYKNHFWHVGWINIYNLLSLLAKIYICDFYFNNYGTVIILSAIRKVEKYDTHQKRIILFIM